MARIKLKRVEDVIYVSNGKTESLLVKLRGRGWFSSIGNTDKANLNLGRLHRWLIDDADSFAHVTVQHFHFVKKGGKR